MPLVTFYDTETTGLLPKYFKMSNIEKLPYMVQLGAILVDTDKDFEELGQIDVLVKPDGFEIPEDSTAIHGIKHDYAVKYGDPLEEVVKSFDAFATSSVGFVAHNIDYDSKIMALSYARAGLDRLGVEVGLAPHQQKSPVGEPSPFRRQERRVLTQYSEFHGQPHDLVTQFAELGVIERAAAAHGGQGCGRGSSQSDLVDQIGDLAGRPQAGDEGVSNRRLVQIELEHELARLTAVMARAHR